MNLSLWIQTYLLLESRLYFVVGQKDSKDGLRSEKYSLATNTWLIMTAQLKCNQIHDIQEFYYK